MELWNCSIRDFYSRYECHITCRWLLTCRISGLENENRQSILYFLIVFLGGSPYPRKRGKDLAPLLRQGYRMPKPQHVDEKLYIKKFKYKDFIFCIFPHVNRKLLSIEFINHAFLF